VNGERADRADRAVVALAHVALSVAVVASFAIGSPRGAQRGAPAAAAFLAAWERKLTGTYAVDQTFTRTVPSGAGLRESMRLVQRPPDRLLSGLGALSGRVGGRLVRCPATADAAAPCLLDAAAPPYEEDVAGEVAVLRGYVTGERPLYAVTAYGDGCFALDLALRFPAPPYGDHALFCFDALTGAPALTVIERVEGVDRTEADTIEAVVSDEDLQVPTGP
jgi:hypothetical protein